MTNHLRKFAAAMIAFGAVLAAPAVGTAQSSCHDYCMSQCRAIYALGDPQLADCYEACMSNGCDTDGPNPR